MVSQACLFSVSLAIQILTSLCDFQHRKHQRIITVSSKWGKEKEKEGRKEEGEKRKQEGGRRKEAGGRRRKQKGGERKDEKGGEGGGRMRKDLS